MGVKDLWNILSPLCERKPLFELQDKSVAIDLSCWIVDSQSVTDNVAQPKMYLRNIFFRTLYLLMQGITPVFVLEGEAPTLKHKTIAKRNDVRTGFQEKKTVRHGRTNFKRVLAECEKMLSYMGIACVQSHGEAEAMCAYLNEDGLVDGCISQDSDCFLYGAKIVYRNFCISSHSYRGNTGASVDEYDILKIEKVLQLGRNKMIALALLCGCDYDDGVNGIGKEAALKLFKTVDDESILDRLRSWKTDSNFEKVEAKLLYSNLCTSCGHHGKTQKHAKIGCVDCATTIGCNDSYKEKRALLLHEIQLRKKVLVLENFPNQELINEFLVRKHKVPTKLELQWRTPQISNFVHFMKKQVAWEPQYAFEKIFPLVTRWQVLHASLSLGRQLFIPEKITKIRNIKSVESYEIVWDDINNIVSELELFCDKPGAQNEDSDTLKIELVTIEPQSLILKCYPNLVEAFTSAKNAKKSRKKGTSKNAKKALSNVDNNCDCDQEKIQKMEKRNGKKTIKNKNKRKIDEFITINQQLPLAKSFGKMSITPKRSKRVVNKANINVKQNDLDYNNEKIKCAPQIRRVLEIERNDKKCVFNNSLDKMFQELSPDDFISESEDIDLNMTETIQRICDKTTCHNNCVGTYNFEKTNDDLCIEVTDDKEKDIKELMNTEVIVIKDSDNSDNEDQCISNDSNVKFDDIECTYVPLYKRIQLQSKKVITTEKLAISIQTEERFSIGFNALMDETDVNIL